MNGSKSTIYCHSSILRNHIQYPIFNPVNYQQLEQLFLTNFAHPATTEQASFFKSLAAFIYSKQHQAFILTGYAGTGKTTLMRSIVTTYLALKGNIVLLAPTGRASKVLAQRAGIPASTIHRHIYIPTNSGGTARFLLRQNQLKHALFVVDEASMIADQPTDSSAFGNRSLLEDLLKYVSMGHYCKVLFIGDTAQLPPVGVPLSPALDPNVLTNTYGLNLVTHQLTQVIRQAEKSVVLKNATAIRQILADGKTDKPQITTAADVVRLTDGWEMEEAFQGLFADSTRENGIMIVRSNNRANKYNFDIRARIQFREDIIASGDRLMVVKNNYYWLPEQSPIGFIANGDAVEVLSLRNRESQYGFDFIDATVQLADYPEQPPTDCKLLLDVLQADAPALTYNQQNKLFEEIEKEYAHIGNRRNRMQQVMSNPYYNALQVKFAHVVTCHKAQGGQWPNVIIEQSWLPTGEVDTEYLRWLYTAFTRAQEKVYLIGFDDSFFAD